MKYTLRQDSIGVNIFLNGVCIGRIDGVEACDLDEDTIEDCLFGDIDDDVFESVNVEEYWL